MIVATWNVNGIRARGQRLAEWLAERKPDVACLQELKITDDEFPHEDLKKAGYYAITSGQAGWNGVAVIAKEPPVLVMKDLPGAEAAGARFVVAQAAGIEVASVYVPNGKMLSHADYKLKLSFLESLATHIEARADRAAPFLLGGDFNVCLTPRDSYGGERFEGHIFQTPEERSLVNRLGGAGLIDLFRTRYPEEAGFSWWDYRAGSFHKKEGMRLDLLWATPAVASRVTDVIVDREYRKKGKPSGAIPSDHAPVYALLS